MERPVITEGQPASLSLFDPAGKTKLENGSTRSKSKNTPFTGKELQGKVAGILNGEKLVLNNVAD
jgi:dihydroorotase